ncbi:MAG: beta-lactamase family protein, partial [Candidatus Aminicenantes bacterium]
MMKKNNKFFKVFYIAALITIPAFVLAVNHKTETEPQPKTIKIIKNFEKAKILQLMKKANIPGLAIAVIRDGEPIWIHGFGRKNVNTPGLVSPNTVFEAASLTKPLFGYLVMKMVEKGELDLDTPLVNYVPASYLEKKVLHHSLKLPGFRLDWFKTITARMILSHSAGLPHGPHSKPLPILFQPGTKFKYSANGYLFLQFIVEYIKKQPLEKIIHHEVFKPLGMTDSSMVWQDSYNTLAAVGHNFIGETDGKFRKRVLAVSASSLYTTINDYTTFITAFLNNKGISLDTKNKMLEPQVKINNELYWSLGFGIEKTQQGDAFWQWGDFGIYKGFIKIFREQKAGVIYFSNSSNGLSIVRDIMELVFGYRELPSISWLGYESYNTPCMHFIDIIKKKTLTQMQPALYALLAKYPDYFTQSKMAGLGRRLLDAGKYKEAAMVCQINVKNHPQSGNAYESLAESYLY